MRKLDGGGGNGAAVLAEKPKIRDERAAESEEYAELNHLSVNWRPGRRILRASRKDPSKGAGPYRRGLKIPFRSGLGLHRDLRNPAGDAAAARGRPPRCGPPGARGRSSKTPPRRAPTRVPAP